MRGSPSCGLVIAVILAFFYLTAVIGLALSATPGPALAVVVESDSRILYWDREYMIVLRGVETLVYSGGSWWLVKGYLAKAACRGSETLYVLAARGPYTAVIGVKGETANAFAVPGTPLALSCGDGGAALLASFGGSLAVATERKAYRLMVQAGVGAEAFTGGVRVSTDGAPLVSGRLIIDPWRGAALLAPEGWTLRGATSLPGGGYALLGTNGEDGLVATISEGGDKVSVYLIDVGGIEEAQAAAATGGPPPWRLVVAVKIEGRVPALVEIDTRGLVEAARYYPYAPMIYRGSAATPGMVGFQVTLVGVGEAVILARSVGYSPLGDAGVVAPTTGVFMRGMEAALKPAGLEWLPIGEPVKIDVSLEPVVGPSVYVYEAPPDRETAALTWAALLAPPLAYLYSAVTTSSECRRTAIRPGSPVAS